MNRSELAALLRRARDRVKPEDVGLATGSRRRVPGLRREEVALLAGISTDYVNRLEQARGPRPSVEVMTALARALRLSLDETSEAFDHADLPQPRASSLCREIRPSLQRLVDRLGDTPVVVISAAGDLLAWNAMAAALLGDFSGLPRAERNVIFQRFLGNASRVSLTPEEDEATAGQSVASLRATWARYPADRDLARLIDTLRSGSARFADLWENSSAAPWRNHTKTITHPDLGPVRLECDALHVPDVDQTVIVYSAGPGTEAAQQLDLLRVIGTERMTFDRDNNTT